MFFPVHIIVAIVLCAFYHTGYSDLPALNVGDMIVETLAYSLLLLLLSYTLTRFGQQYILRYGLETGSALQLGQGIHTLLKILSVLVYFAQLSLAGWPGGLIPLLGFQACQTGLMVVTLLPFLAGLVLIFTQTYSLDLRLHPQHWSFFGYLSFQLRYSLYILIPWLLLSALSDLTGIFFPTLEDSGLPSWILLLAPLGIILLVFPYILTRIWECRAITAGPLYSELETLQERAGVKFSRMFIWKFGNHGLMNGAVLGFLPRFRYLLLSEGLVNRLTTDELLGVAAHELGHIRRHHLIFYLLLTFGFFLPLETLLRVSSLSPMTMAFYFALATALFFRFLFGFVSRQFEREADLYSLDLLGRTEPLITSLEKIGFLSGNIRDLRSWHHYSIAQRVAFLNQAQQDPGIGAEHRHRCQSLRRLGGGFTVLLILFSLILPSAAEESALSHPTAAHGLMLSHWLRIDELLPEDSDAPAEIARLLLDTSPVEPDNLRIISIQLERARHRASSKDLQEKVLLIENKLKEQLAEGGNPDGR